MSGYLGLREDVCYRAGLVAQITALLARPAGRVAVFSPAPTSPSVAGAAAAGPRHLTVQAAGYNPGDGPG